MSLTGWIKLAVIAVIVGFVGYSYKWTYDRGGDVREATYKVKAAKAVSDALEKQEREFRDLRALEMREAAETAAQLQANEIKKTSNLFKIIDALKNQECSEQRVPADAIRVLNDGYTPTPAS